MSGTSGLTLEEIHGVKRAREIKRKISESEKGNKNHFYGKKHTEKTKRLMSEIRIRNDYHTSGEFKKGQTPWNKGKKSVPRVSKSVLKTLYYEKELTTEKVGVVFGVRALTVRKWMEYYGLKRRKPSEFKMGDEQRRHIKENHWSKKPEWKEKFDALIEKNKFKKGEPPWCKGLTKEEHPSLMRISEKLKEDWGKPEQRQRRVKLWIKGNKKSPNNPEKAFMSLCEKYQLPYKYVGDGGVVLGGHIPDFINTNGEKKIVNINGIYWHLWKHQKENPSLTKKDVEIKEMAHYEPYGFKSIIIWEDEMDNDKIILKKLGITYK